MKDRYLLGTSKRRQFAAAKLAACRIHLSNPTPKKRKGNQNRKWKQGRVREKSEREEEA